MKTLSFVATLLLLLSFTACGESGPTEAELQAEAEVARLDSINQLLETSIIEMEEDADDLNDALKELDELFPEDQNQ
jgi:predicted small lipoprotein YifL